MAQLMNDTDNDVDGLTRGCCKLATAKAVTEPTKAKVEDLNDPHTNP